MSIAHIAVYTENIEKSKAFYSIFGAKEVDRITLGKGDDGRTL